MLIACCIIAIGANKHAHKIEQDEEGLDYSHNIFIPLNAYENYELFMEYAVSSGLGM